MLEKARKDKPDSPALRFLLGWHYGYLGYPVQAVKELDKAVELAPQDEVTKKLRDVMVAKLPKTEGAAPTPAVTTAPVEQPATKSAEQVVEQVVDSSEAKPVTNP